MSASHLAEFVEDGASSYPSGEAVSLPYVLAKFHLRLHLVLVSIAAFIVATHGVRVAQLGHHRPRRIAEVEVATNVGRQYSAFPDATIAADVERGLREGIVVAEESRAEALRDVNIDAAVGIGQHIAAVENEAESYTHVVGRQRDRGQVSVLPFRINDY